MNKKTIGSLLEAKRQIDDTITQLIRENGTDMSALSKCEYMLLGSCIIFPQHFLDWCLSRGFLSTATEERPLSEVLLRFQGMCQEQTLSG